MGARDGDVRAAVERDNGRLPERAAEWLPREEPASEGNPGGPPASDWLPSSFTPPLRTSEPTTREPAGQEAPADAESEPSEREQDPSEIDALHQRLTGVEERAMESLEIEIDAQQETLRHIALRQDQIEQRLAELVERDDEYGRERAALTAASESLFRRIEALERRLEEEAARPSQRSAEHARAASYQGEHQAVASGDGERIDINAASFDQLRALGLSVTQAARLIARRDAVDGFTSRQEIEALPGFPRPLVDDLLNRIRI